MRRRDIRAERKASEASRWSAMTPLDEQDWRDIRDKEPDEFPEPEDDWNQPGMLQ